MRTKVFALVLASLALGSTASLTLGGIAAAQTAPTPDNPDGCERRKPETPTT